MDTDGLRKQERELADELATLEERREGIQDELASAREELQESREERERGEGSLAQLSDAQSAYAAAEALDGDLGDRIKGLRSELREVRARLAREEALDALAEKAGRASELFEQWDAERVALAREIEKRTTSILDLEEQLASLLKSVATELDRFDAGLSNLTSRGVEIGPLVGYRKPSPSIGVGWVRGNPLGYKGGRPTRSDLGGGEDAVADLVDAARKRRERQGRAAIAE